MQKKGGFSKNQLLIQPSSKNKVLFKSFNDMVEKESIKEAQSVEREYNKMLNNLDYKSSQTNEINNDTNSNENLSVRWKKMLAQSNQSPAKRKVSGVMQTLGDESYASKSAQNMLKKEDFAEISVNYDSVSPKAGIYTLDNKFTLHRQI